MFSYSIQFKPSVFYKIFLSNMEDHIFWVPSMHLNTVETRNIYLIINFQAEQY